MNTLQNYSTYSNPQSLKTLSFLFLIHDCSEQHDEQKYKWYIVTKIVLTYCEKKLF